MNKKLILLTATLLSLSFFAGCESKGGGDDSSGLLLLLAAGGSAAAENGGSSAAEALHTCRTYDTQSTSSTGVVSINNFDTSTFKLTQILTAPGGSPSTHVHHYNSVADFVNETAVVPPKSKYQSITYSGGSSTATYDSSGNMIGQNSGGIDLDFTAWDSFGRPTAGTYVTYTAGCSNFPETRTYDDVNRKLTITTNFGGCISGLNTPSSVIKYDVNGNLIRTSYDKNNDGDFVDAGDNDVSYTLNSTAVICK